MEYRKEIDGLRALAILPVVLFHINKHMLPGGYVGVDIFFVISGFLITSILLKEHEEGNFSFQTFWCRRIRRILPILTLVVLFVLVGALFFSYKPDIRVFGHYGISALLSYANVAHWLQAGNYWGNTAEDSPFLHIWSLSVEEQFYLLFPIILYYLIKYVRRWLVAFFSIAVLFSFALYVYGTLNYPSGTFYLLPTRAWEIGVGVLVALHMRGNGDESKGYKVERYAPAVVLFSIGCMFWSFWYLDASSGNTQIALFVPVIATAFVIIYSGNSHKKCLGTTILSLPVVVGTGKLSYSMYLWHWPTLVFLRSFWGREFGINQILLYLFIVTLLSSLSYNFIENTFRKSASSLRLILGVWFAVTGFALSLCFVDAHENVTQFQPTIWHGELYNVNPVRTWSDKISARMYGIESPTPSEISPTIHRMGIIRHHDSNMPDILVFGDSHGLMWSKVLDEIASELGASITFYTADGTNPFFTVPPVIENKGSKLFSAQQKYEFEYAKYEHLNQKPPELLIILTPWGNYQDVVRTKSLLDFTLKKGVSVITISQPPCLSFGDKNAPQYISFNKRDGDFTGDIYMADYNNKIMENNLNNLRQLSNQYSNLQFLDLTDIFIRNEGVLVAKDRKVLYIDDDHLSYSGAQLVKQRIKDLIIKVLKV